MDTQSRKRQTKVLAVLCLLFCVGVVLTARFRLPANQLPIGYLLLAAAIACVGFGHFYTPYPYVPVVLSGWIVVSLVAAVLAPASNNQLIAYDPHGTLYHVNWIQDTGTILMEHTGLRGGGRGIAYPGLFSFAAVWVLVIGIETELALSILPLVLLPLLPLGLYLIGGSRWAIVSLFGVVPGFYVFFGVVPVAQMTVYPLLVLVCLLAFKVHQSPDQWHMLLLLALGVTTLALTHTYTAVVAVFALVGLALTPTQRIYETITIPILATIVVVSVWVVQETSPMLQQAAGLIVLLTTGIEIRELPTPPELTSRHPAEIEILSITRFAPDWLAFGVRVAFFLLLGWLFVYTGGRALVRFESAAWSDEIRLFGFGAIGALLVTFLVPDVNFNRFWVLAMLLAPPAIVALRGRIPIRSQHILATCVVLVVIAQSFALAPAVFSDTADPQSYRDGGRPVYHSGAEYATAEFIANQELTPVTSDIRMFFIEPRYQQQSRQASECYVDSCSEPVVIWQNQYSEFWISSQGHAAFSEGKMRLDASRNAIYSAEEITLYTKTEGQ